MTDLTALTTPFGLLDRETQEALTAHGGPIEQYTSCGETGWRPHVMHKVSYHPCVVYRVKPAPPKPREWWVSGGNCIWDTYAEAYNACDRGEKPIHVREVLPE